MTGLSPENNKDFLDSVKETLKKRLEPERKLRVPKETMAAVIKDLNLLHGLKIPEDEK